MVITNNNPTGGNPTTNPKTFKWGEHEYLIDDLLKEHGKHKNSYYGFAINRGQFDTAALDKLKIAIADRIDAVKGGTSFYADGTLDTDLIDNTRIITQKKGLFKKEKYVDQDITEWAIFYLNKLVGGIKPYEKPAAPDKEAFDISEHGLSAYLTGQGLNPLDIFQNYDLRSETDPEAPRSFNERDAVLEEHLPGYRTWLNGKGFDFTKNDNEWDDNFMDTLSNLISNQDWSDRTALAASLRKLGGEKYTTAFTSDRWDLSKSDEEIEAERKAAADRKKKEEMDKAWKDEVARRYNIYKGSSARSGQMQQYMGVDRAFELTDEDINYYNDLVGISTPADERAHWDGLDLRYASNPYDASIAQIILPLRDRQGLLKSIDSGDYSGWKYDPTTINEDRQSVMAFDPITGKMEEIFIGHLTNDWARIKNRFMQEKGYTDPLAAFNKEGGVLKFQTGGTLSSYDYMQSYKKNKNAERAAETGNTKEVRKSRDRVVSTGDKVLKSADATLAQPDAGFTEADTARLISIGADIVSMVLDPITGTVVGLGSSLTNFGADVADDGFQWEDVKNLGINVGFDLLGAIPLFGDAVGTGGKIIRNLVKWTPRIMAGMAAFQGVQNFDGMMSSLDKVLSRDKDQKLTVQDWRNIAQSISLVTGGVRAIRNKAQQSKMRNEARVDGVLGVNVRTKDGNIEQILVDGKTAEQIRNAKNTTEVEKVLNDLDDYKGKFGEDGDFVVNTKNNGSWQSPVHRRELTDGSGKKEWEYRGFRQSGKADVNEVYDFRRVSGYGSGIGLKIPWFSNKFNQWHKNLITYANKNKKLNPTTVDQRGKMTNEAIEAEQTRLLNEKGVEAQIGKVKDAVEARHKSLAKTDEFISKTKSEIETQKRLADGDDFVAIQADAEARLRGLPSNNAINDAHNAIAHHTAVIARNKAKRTSLSDSKRKNLSDMEGGLNKRLQDKIESRKNLRKRQKLIENKLSDGKPHPKYEAELNRVKNEIKLLNKDIRNLPTQIKDTKAKIHSQYQKAYTQLGASTKSSKTAIAAAQPIAAQRKAYSEAYAQQQAAILGQDLQSRLNTLQGRRASHDPATAHTHAFNELQNILNDLNISNPVIGGRTINWDMDAILQKYGVNSSDVFKQGGSINRNKLNKYLNYAKG